jgi:hypothetical protein
MIKTKWLNRFIAKKSITLPTLLKQPVVKMSAVFLASFIILYLRDPGALINAQFWAEDGAVWFQDAYNSHFSVFTIFEPYAGYLGVFPRLVATLSWFVGMSNAPLLFSTVALLVQTLPVVYLWSKRCNRIVPNTYARLIITVFYLTLPYMTEIHATPTNSQWFLAIVSFILLFSVPAKSLLLRVLDNLILGISILSGPFGLFLTPIALTEYVLNKKDRPRLKPKLAIVAIATAIQAIVILYIIIFGNEPRGSAAIGLSITNLIDIVGGQIFGSGLYGQQSFTFFVSKPWIATVVAILGLQLMIFALIRGPKILKYFIVYSGAVVVSALLSPPAGSVTSEGGTYWGLLSEVVGMGGRYYFLLHLALVATLVWIIFSNSHIFLKGTACIILVSSMIIGVRADFKILPWTDHDYAYKSYARKFDKLQPGQRIDIPISPGGIWKIELQKHK